jgi:hypothetical protein
MIKGGRILNVFKVVSVLYIILAFEGFAQEPLKILPLGNSITYDTYEGDTRSTGDKISYRYKLYQLLNQAGYNFDFIGSKNSGWNYFNDDENAGYPGWRDNQLADLLEDGYLNTYPADIILLHIGSNDVWANDYNNVTDVERLLDAVDDFESSSGNTVIVLLALIISWENYPCGTHTGTSTFNNNLLSMANDRINAGDKIIIVDMECGADIDYSTDMIDFLHPNQSGYDKMGQKWFNTIDAINNAPTLSDIPDKQINEGSTDTINLDLYVSDIENTDQEIIWTISPENPTYLDVTIDDDRVATIAPRDSNWNGSETITFIATDRGNILEGLKKSVSDDVQFTVAPVNDPPVIISQKTSLSTPEETSLEILISHLNVEDIDNDISELSLTVNPGTDYTFSGNIITPSTDFNGTLNVNVIVSDPEDDSDVFSMDVEVTPNNDVPVIVSQSLIEVQEEGSVELLLTYLDVTDPDNVYPDEHTLIVMDGDNYTHDSNIVTPDTDFNGSLAVPVKVRDLQYESDTFDLIIDVLAVNDTPRFTSIPDTSAEEGSDYEYYFTAEDAEDEVLTFTLLKKPEWLGVLFYDSGGLFLGKPGYEDAGQDSVILRATDSQSAFSEQMFVINIKNTTALIENETGFTELIYPNPATDYIKVKPHESFANGIFQLFNLFGEEVISEPVYPDTEVTINLNRERILPGVYFYRITYKNNKIKGGKIMIINN